jgi:uncharacterized membrane protein YecN with MAPEG domain
MGSFPIKTLYAGVLGLLLIVLTARIIRVVRIKGGVSLGDGGNPSRLIHALGAALVAARIAPPLGLKAANKPTALRFLGAVGTFLVVIVASIACILASF